MAEEHPRWDNMIKLIRMFGKTWYIQQVSQADARGKTGRTHPARFAARMQAATSAAASADARGKIRSDPSRPGANANAAAALEFRHNTCSLENSYHLLILHS